MRRRRGRRRGEVGLSGLVDELRLVAVVLWRLLDVLCGWVGAGEVPEGGDEEEGEQEEGPRR